jgi:cbb3-type cytochrome oxidase subunit 1
MMMMMMMRADRQTGPGPSQTATIAIMHTQAQVYAFIAMASLARIRNRVSKKCLRGRCNQELAAWMWRTQYSYSTLATTKKATAGILLMHSKYRVMATLPRAHQLQ